MGTRDRPSSSPAPGSCGLSPPSRPVRKPGRVLDPGQGQATHGQEHALLRTPLRRPQCAITLSPCAVRTRSCLLPMGDDWRTDVRSTKMKALPAP